MSSPETPRKKKVTLTNSPGGTNIPRNQAIGGGGLSATIPNSGAQTNTPPPAIGATPIVITTTTATTTATTTTTTTTTATATATAAEVPSAPVTPASKIDGLLVTQYNHANADADWTTAPRGFLTRSENQLAAKLDGDQKERLLAWVAIGNSLLGGSEQESEPAGYAEARERIGYVKESQRLAFVVERITEIRINQEMASKPTKPSASSSAQTYAQALKEAFGIKNDDHATIRIGNWRGRHELPKTIAAVVGRSSDGSLRVLLGQNSGQHDLENKHRADVIPSTIRDSKAAIETHVKGSLTENPRDLLNCAECLPFGSHLRDKRTGMESQALRRDEGNKYTPCDPCENCQSLYQLKTAAEKRREDLEAERTAMEKERAAKLKEQDRQNAKAQQKHQTAKVDLEGDVQRIAEQLGPSEKKAFGRLYGSKLFPKAKLGSTWGGYSTDDQKKTRLRELLREAETLENPKKKLENPKKKLEDPKKKKK